MAVYARPPAMPPAGFFTWPVCFTGTDVGLFKPLLVALEMVTGAIAGALVGLLVSFLAGPEVLPQMAGFAAGLLVGAVVGTIGGAVLVSKSSCPCPPPAEGFCICFLFLRLPLPGSPLVPIPPYFVPCTAECAPPPAGLVPAGCP